MDGVISVTVQMLQVALFCLLFVFVLFPSSAPAYFE
jgi:hypothetical protein